MSKRICVIGAGIIGLSVAESLLRSGHQVTIVDSDLAAEGCSFGNGGIVVPSHFVPLASPGALKFGLKMIMEPTSPFGLLRLPNLETAAWIGRFFAAATPKRVAKAAPVLKDLNRKSRDCYEALIQRLHVEAGYEQKGLVMACATEQGLKEEWELAHDASRLGLTTRTLSADEVAELEPGAPMSVVGGVLFEDDAHMTPPLMMQGLRQSLQNAGVHIVQATVDRLQNVGGHVQAAVGAGFEIEADEFVVAAGAWSGKLIRPFGLKMPLLSGKGYGFTVPNPPIQLQRPAILAEARVAVTPMTDGIRFVGTLELGAPAPGINEARLRGMRAGIDHFYPGFQSVNWDSIPVWFGHRPCTPDGMPYIGRCQGVDNLTIATGHAMMGMSLGPITGDLVAAVIDGVTPPVSLELLDPNRYE